MSILKELGKWAGGAALFGMVGAAHAALITLPTGFGILEDDNIEYVLDAAGNLKTEGDLVVGDRLRAVITFTKVQDSANNTVQALGAPGTELTGISEIEIIGLAGDDFVFGPSASFEATYGMGAMAALYEQNPGDFGTNCGTVLACETAATNGALWLVAGFADDDDFWASSGVLSAMGALDIETVAATAGVTKVAVANYALSILQNNTGYTLGQQACALCVGTDKLTDIIGSGDVLGGAGLTSPYFARSDFDFQVNRVNVVPEPGIMTLFASGLLLLGWATRRRATV